MSILVCKQSLDYLPATHGPATHCLSATHELLLPVMHSLLPSRTWTLAPSHALIASQSCTHCLPVMHSLPPSHALIASQSHMDSCSQSCTHCLPAGHELLLPVMHSLRPLPLSRTWTLAPSHALIAFQQHTEPHMDSCSQSCAHCLPAAHLPPSHIWTLAPSHALIASQPHTCLQATYGLLLPVMRSLPRSHTLASKPHMDSCSQSCTHCFPAAHPHMASCSQSCTHCLPAAHCLSATHGLLLPVMHSLPPSRT